MAQICCICSFKVVATSSTTCDQISQASPLCISIHTASDEILEVGTTWERGYWSIGLLAGFLDTSFNISQPWALDTYSTLPLPKLRLQIVLNCLAVHKKQFTTWYVVYLYQVSQRLAWSNKDQLQLKQTTKWGREGGISECPHPPLCLYHGDWWLPCLWVQPMHNAYACNNCTILHTAIRGQRSCVSVYKPLHSLAWPDPIPHRGTGSGT